METGSHQLTPCFSTRSPPTTNSLPFPSRSTRLSIASAPPLLTPFFSLSLSRPHPFHLSLSLSLCLSHPSSPSSISRSLHQPHPCFSSPPHPFIPHWLHFYPLALFFPPLLLFDFPLPSTFPLFTAAQIKPTTLCEILKRRD